MILPNPRRRDKSVVQTNVLPVPPLPYTKNSLPLFVCHDIQNSFICVALIIIEPIFYIICICDQ
jgi:hypothetical protein